MGKQMNKNQRVSVSAIKKLFSSILVFMLVVTMMPGQAAFAEVLKERFEVSAQGSVTGSEAESVANATAVQEAVVSEEGESGINNAKEPLSVESPASSGDVQGGEEPQGIATKEGLAFEAEEILPAPLGTPPSPQPRAGSEEFKFEVTVGNNDTFYLPTSGNLGDSYNKSYSWNIDWGDTRSGSYTQADSANSRDSAGIPHFYAVAGTYTITLAPNGTPDAWLGSFGFGGSGAASTQSNKNKLAKLLSPITPLMTRTQAQIDSQTAPSYEWADTFSFCYKLTMGDAFTFSDEWESITTAGDYFASDMFSFCLGAAFTMNNTFNLPQGITSVGDGFALNMFYNCSGAAFTMNDIFNLPQGITSVGGYFAVAMFLQCSGAAFTMNDIFNLPQGITAGGDAFALYMFRSCHGAAFTMNNIFNLPQGITSVGFDFANNMFYYCHGAAFTMNNIFNLPQGITTAGDNFASEMFFYCSGAAFTMNNIFNLPQGITTVGDVFASSMFFYCSGAAFTMNNIFNLPQGITTVGDNFASSMFFYCSGAAFTMNNIFNFPQGITTVGNSFAYNMFSNCSGTAFQVNTVFKFPSLSQTELDKYTVFYRVFEGVSAQQTRTAASIINSPEGESPLTEYFPESSKGTFSTTGADAFSDLLDIHANWGGLADCILTYDLNGGIAGSGPSQKGLKAGVARTINSSVKPTHAPVGGSAVVLVGWSATPVSKIYAEGDTLDSGLIITTVTSTVDTSVYAVWGFDTNGNGEADINEDLKAVITHYRDRQGVVLHADTEAKVPAATSYTGTSAPQIDRYVYVGADMSEPTQTAPSLVNDRSLPTLPNVTQKTEVWYIYGEDKVTGSGAAGANGTEDLEVQCSWVDPDGNNIAVALPQTADFFDVGSVFNLDYRSGGDIPDDWTYVGYKLNGGSLNRLTSPLTRSDTSFVVELALPLVKTVEYVFARSTCSLTITHVDDKGNSIGSQDEIVTVAFGDTFKQDAAVIEGYTYDYWTLDGVSQGASQPSLTNITSAHSIQLVYKAVTGFDPGFDPDSDPIPLVTGGGLAQAGDSASALPWVLFGGISGVLLLVAAFAHRRRKVQKTHD